MSNRVKLMLVPTTDMFCAAMVLSEQKPWDDSSLEIKWDSKEREFIVIFKGAGVPDLTVDQALSTRVPLQIARASRCRCGGTLELGNYRIITTKNDFTFEGTYFCPTCKTDFLAEQSGFRHFITKWIRGLKKIEIKAGGVGLERE